MNKFYTPPFLKAHKNEKNIIKVNPPKPNSLVAGMKEMIIPLLDDKITIENNYIHHLSRLNSDLKKENERLVEERNQLLEILIAKDPNIKEKLKNFIQS